MGLVSHEAAEELLERLEVLFLGQGCPEKMELQIVLSEKSAKNYCFSDELFDCFSDCLFFYMN